MDPVAYVRFRRAALLSGQPFSDIRYWDTEYGYQPRPRPSPRTPPMRENRIA